MPYSAVREGEDTWALINHLSQNYLGLSDENNGGDALREILRLCIKHGDPQLQRDLEAIRSVVGTTIIGPFPAPGPRQFTRGLEITLTCEEKALGGQRAFLLAGVLSKFFARHASTHSFTVTVLRTLERGEVYRWPAVAGLRGAI
jgi:type VI secretion system protein ImpG